MNWDQIAKTISERHDVAIVAPTCVRAYDYARPEIVKRTAETGIKPQRGRHVSLDPAVYVKLRELVLNHPNAKASEIAADAGCGATTVKRERRRLELDHQ